MLFLYLFVVCFSFAEGKSDKEILDHLLTNTRYDKRLLPPVDGTFYKHYGFRIPINSSYICTFFKSFCSFLPLKIIQRAHCMLYNVCTNNIMLPTFFNNIYFLFAFAFQIGYFKKIIITITYCSSKVLLHSLCIFKIYNYGICVADSYFLHNIFFLFSMHTYITVNKTAFILFFLI